MGHEKTAPLKSRFALLIRLAAAIALGSVFGLAMRAAGFSLPGWTRAACHRAADSA